MFSNTTIKELSAEGSFLLYVSKKADKGVLLFMGSATIIALDRRDNNVRTIPTQESFGQAFSKACGFGQSP